jgi:cyclopropane fatty-acyl-phospholipid synthase-like methyltransferase
VNNQKEWWEGFFSGLWLDVQGETKTEEQTRIEADFIQNVLQLAPQSKVLDVPCGEGRHSIELAARGCQVTGVDITLPFLNEAQHQAKEQQLEVAWEHRDMRDLPWEEEFDGVFCFWGSFGYFEDKGNADFLKAVSRVLKPRAKFLLDTHVTETLLPKLSQERGWRRVGNTLVLEERHYDHVCGRTKTEWTLVQDGKTFEKSTSIRLYTYRELCQLLEGLGFADPEGYGSLSGEPFQLGSPRLYLVVTKK